MRQLPSDKYNVAWFKLAEFVVRGEKERALGLYRLLVHSFDDRALAFQLEGDLLLSFNDIQAAKEKYGSAAQAYKVVGRYIEAAAVYEHLHILSPEQEEFSFSLLALYQHLNLSRQLGIILKQLCEFYLSKNEWDKTISLLDQYEPLIEMCQKAEIYSLITLDLVKQKKDIDQIDIFLSQTIDFLMLSSDGQQMPNFLMQLDALDNNHYQKALKCIKE